ncbi:hypothetical protein ACLIBH_13130 [Virgibacillus sp. W0430]|uniref:hypothetical protein n=1 Tax=Virgibacillus sp. W0430 TaxID=3391580 RepID=UPI003F472B3B
MKQAIRAFSIGLFTASTILLLFYFFQESNKAERTYSLEELTDMVEDTGNRIVTEEEYITLSLLKDEEKNTEPSEDLVDTSENSEAQQTQPEVKAPLTYTLKIEPNMMPTTVSKLLESNKIVEDASKLDNYLEEHDISTLIQIGEHQLTSDMSIAEIATMITK